MPKPINTHEEFLKKLQDKGLLSEYSILSKYTGYSSNIVVLHKKCNTTFSILPTSLLNQKSCRRCTYIKNRKNNSEAFFGKVKKLHGNKFIIRSEFSNQGSNITIECKLCGCIKTIHAHNLLNPEYHVTCIPKKAPPQKEEVFIRKVKKVHQDKFEFLSKYVNMRTKIKIRCTKCGKIWWVSPGSLYKENYHTCGKEQS